MAIVWLCQRSANKVIIITSDFDGANLCDYLSNCLADGHVTITPPFHSNIPIVCKR